MYSDSFTANTGLFILSGRPRSYLKLVVLLIILRDYPCNCQENLISNLNSLEVAIKYFG